MIRPARAGDEAAIEAFLAKHPETSMFLRGNLANFRLNDREDATGTKFFLDETHEIQAVFSITNGGFLMCQAPHATPEFWTTFGGIFAGETIAGVTGDVLQTTEIKRALGLESAVFSLNETEPLYRLSLDRLVDQGPADLRIPTINDLPLLRDWMYICDTETLGVAKGEETHERVKIKAQKVLDRGQTRLLFENNIPVAKTAFDATLPEIVQIGDVFTPHQFRNRGLARRAVAAHLKEVHKTGVETAILFASSTAACRAYEAIGFKRIGEYAIEILSEPQTIRAKS